VVQKVEKPRQKGFGSRLLESALCRELGARVELTFAPSGVVCEIETPLT
jgi:two-component sensor histidine kinase